MRNELKVGDYCYNNWNQEYTTVVQIVAKTGSVAFRKYEVKIIREGRKFVKSHDRYFVHRWFLRKMSELQLSKLMLELL